MIAFSNRPRNAYADGILCIAKMKHDRIAALMTPEVVIKVNQAIGEIMDLVFKPDSEDGAGLIHGEVRELSTFI